MSRARRTGPASVADASEPASSVLMVSVSPLPDASMAVAKRTTVVTPLIGPGVTVMAGLVLRAVPMTEAVTVLAVPAEVPVALVYDGSTFAVMMASPSDLEDFALGFSLTEGVVTSIEEIASLDVIEQKRGIELRMWLSPSRGHKLAERRRRMAGRAGLVVRARQSLFKSDAQMA